MHAKSSDARQGRSLRVGLVFALSFLGLLVVLLWWQVSAVETRQDGNELEPSSETPPLTSKEPRLALTKQASRQTDAVSGSTPAEAEVQPTMQRVTLRFEHADGDSIQGLRVGYGLVGRGGDVLPVPVDHARPERERAANVEWPGCLEIDSSRTVQLIRGQGEFPPASQIRLISLSPKWTLANPSSGAKGAFPEEIALDISPEGGTYVVPVFRTTRRWILVRYEDGEFYGGEVRVLGQEARKSRYVKVAPGEAVELTEFPIEPGVTVHVTSVRRFFHPSTSFSLIASDARPLEVLVIRAHPKQTELIVDLSLWPVESNPEICCYLSTGSRPDKHKAIAGNVWRCLTLLGDCNYVVVVSGKAVVWRSPLFLLPYGESREFKAIPQSGFSCKVKVVDPEGKPLPGAVVCTVKDTYTPWFSRKGASESGVGDNYAATTNREGLATLLSLFPGQCEITAEAKGYEPKSITLSGTDGGEVDAGEIQLARATGRIEVTLRNRNPSVGYHLTLFPPKPGMPIAQMRDVKEDTVVFEGLACRPYVIHVAPGNGGQGLGYLNVSATFGGHTICRIEADVTGIDLPRR